jgi:hypothetical protein
LKSFVGLTSWLAACVVRGDSIRGRAKRRRKQVSGMRRGSDPLVALLLRLQLGEYARLKWKKSCCEKGLPVSLYYSYWFRSTRTFCTHCILSRRVLQAQVTFSSAGSKSFDSTLTLRQHAPGHRPPMQLQQQKQQKWRERHLHWLIFRIIYYRCRL